MRSLAADLAGDIVRRYRIEHDAAVDMVVESFNRNRALVSAVGDAESVDKVKRLRVYRDAATAAKKEIYHHLRRYRPAESSATEAVDRLVAEHSAEAIQAVVAGHVSTAERLSGIEDFFSQLFDHIGSPNSIIDVGCGVLPLVFPLDDPPVAQLWAVDTDPEAIRAVSAHARVDQRVHPVRWDLTEDWPALHAQGLPARLDVALVLKVLPVVARRSPQALAVLASTPADLLVFSGSRTAMAKRQDIERRETGVLRRFFAEHGFTEVGEFRTEDEICLVVRRG
ncbi:hypothetical protein [Actinokineospora globicatena]|uniref:16S rRNA (guanine(1405)-N(7))-methyltransferase n=1 Tax=Actinokineospora globicatena TaxID=103729 RepID=A0A9W6QNH3_9PSEU|nr:hypothetical protein [Actinokineospora globicatena]MCP2302380.1 16S rRNA (guanine(1405)-N(7))-methyltransferase [Actinokineospora globicatena]GLW75946.1 hypothetical protein Aglo01_04280 [Actinokineospora globicatena]GLW82786.1 hypothetical protein Aglo02_04260 [Actinokineospora globicatena]GLW91719.1 hypothetical protein Aglo03_25350 [Actinokineospora globicatena]